MKMKFLIDLSESEEAYGVHSEAVVKLSRLGIMSVPNPFCVEPEAFDYYFERGKFPNGFESELKEAYAKMTKKGYPVTVRTPDIKSPTVSHTSLALGNTMFIKTYAKFYETLLNKYNVIQDELLREDIQDAQVATLMHSTYDSNECGLVQTDDGYGQIRIEAGFGQNSNILSRNDVNPDVYVVDKKSLRIKEKKINKKLFEFVSRSRGGIKKVALPKKEQTVQVFSDQVIKKFAEFALKLEDNYGPQEFECAVTTKRDLLIQETRPMKVVKKAKTVEGVTAIVPGRVEGKVVNARKMVDLNEKCRQAIVIADSMEIDFITVLVFKYGPKAVILKQGTLTAHAATILRESGTISYIIKSIELPDGVRVLINEDGSMETYG